MPTNSMNPRASANNIGIKVIETQSLISPNQEKPPLLESSLTPVGKPDTDKVQILVGPQAFSRIDQHIRSDMTHEVGGFLVGKPYEWDGKKYVEILDAVSAEATSSSAVHLTISPNTWVQAQNLLREKFPDMYIVGWYHTHPRMALFLSSQDLSIHEGFFREAWHVALVLDPTRSEAAFFIWDEGRVRIASGYQVNYPTDLNVSDRWQPSTSKTYSYASGAVLEDFYQVGYWHTHWVDGDDLIVKVPKNAFDLLVEKEKGDKPHQRSQIGICIGCSQKNRMMNQPYNLLEIWQIEPIPTSIKELFASSTGVRKFAEMFYSKFGEIESVLGIYIVMPNPPIKLAKIILERFKLLLISDGLPGIYMKCAWKNSDGRIIEREMAEMVNLSEANGEKLAQLIKSVQDACETLNF